jgi:hypothetical protein
MINNIFYNFTEAVATPSSTDAVEKTSAGRAHTSLDGVLGLLGESDMWMGSE